MSDLNDELNEFKIEAGELLETAEKSLLSLEQGGDFKSNFDAIFRVFHNLKGASGMMGLTELGQHMHVLENNLNATKSVGQISKEQIDSFLKGVDQARVILGFKEPLASQDNASTSVEVKKETGGEVKPSTESIEEEFSAASIKEFLIEANEISNRISIYVELMDKGGIDHDTVDALYRDVHTLKGGSYLYKFKLLGDLTHSLESVLDLLRNQKVSATKSLIDRLYDAVRFIERYLQAVPNPCSEELNDQINDIISFFNLFIKSPVKPIEATPEVQPVTALAPTPVATTAPVAAPATTIAPAPAPASTVANVDLDKEANGTIRVSVSLLDKLMTLMGEMVLVRNQVIQYATKTDDLEFLNLSQRLNVITGEIQGEMMKTRMQPVGQVLSKFTRLVRELSKDLGKKIELQMSGNETELDKTLLEAIKDPLTHIVRNSCDHGIESTAERIAAGKSEIGNIFIRSYHEGGQVIVEISDDGKGLHREKLVNKALEKGIITPDKVSTLSDREIINLIFAPGFSTAAQVTNVSGRGVGMDVVKTNIEKIGGTVDIQSVQGQGTSIKLRIPLTLAIVPAIIVRCGADHFAIPQLKLVELVRVEPNQTDNKVECLHENPVLRLRGNILPLVDINKVLGIEAKLKLSEVFNIVVLESEGYTFGLIVDEIQDTADIVVKPLARFLKPLSIYSGATVLGDGAIALILDVAGIIRDVISPQDQARSATGFESTDNKKALEDMQDFLLFKTSAKEKYAFLLSYVHRLEEFKSSQIEVSGHRRLVRYRNTVLPLISLDESIGLAPVKSETRDVVSVVVIEKGGHLYGLEVEEILDVLTTPSILDTTLSQANGIIGNLVQKDEIIVIVNPYQIIQTKMGLETRSVLNEAKQVHAVNSPDRIQKVLYVEDAAFFRRHVQKVLQNAGYEVKTAQNGKEAKDLLSRADRSEFDYIVSDIEMPIMNGFDFAQFVRSDQKWKEVPLIALSTRSDQSHVDRGLKIGFDAYLEKMNGDELVKSLHPYIRKGVA